LPLPGNQDERGQKNGALLLKPFPPEGMSFISKQQDLKEMR